MSVDQNKVSAFVQACIDKFENKQSNKKANINGDYTGDTVSYPTVQAVKDWVTNNFINNTNLNTKTVTVEEVAAESGFAKTYVVKQNNVQVGSKINIPKDFLVKSGQVKTCSTKDQPVAGYNVRDKYIDFVINAKDSSASDEHMYILVSDLVEDTTYTADNSTLQLSAQNQFSVKDGGITKNKLAAAVQTSLGYADNWNSSAAKNISSTDISNWNSAASSSVSISDVDDEINNYLDAITTALTS